MNKNLVIGLISLVALGVSVASFTKTPETIIGSEGPRGPQGLQGPVGPMGPVGPAGKDGRDGKDGKNGVSLGAVASPDIMSPYFSYGDVRHWAKKTTALNQATTTVCAIQSPAATSTLNFGAVRFSVSSTTASTVTLAKASTPYATTTRLAFGSIAANAQGTIFAQATSTGTGITSATDDITTFAPNTYFVVGMAGGIGTFSPTGVCQASFTEI